MISMPEEFGLAAFQALVNISMEDMCRGLFLDKNNSIKIKKEGVAVKNLVKIFDAALRLSNEKGFAAMSLRGLSAEAGLSMGALYAYFSSKEELLEMILRLGRSVVLQVIAAQIQDIDDPRARLKRAIHAHLYLSEIMQPWFYFSYMETKNLDKAEQKNAIATELFTENIFKDIIEQGISSGMFRQVNAGLASSIIKAMLQDWYLKRWKFRRREIAVEEYACFLMEVLDSYMGLRDQ